VAENNWRTWWPLQADAIAADIRTRLPAAVTAWRLTELVPLSGGEVALVFAVATPDREALLKLSPRVAAETDALAQEGSALELWACEGIAPHVLAKRDDGLTLLLEHVRPGHDLRRADAFEIMRTLGALCSQVHLAVSPGQFRQLGEGSQAESWRRALAGTRELAEPERLLVPNREDRLLHIDLHWRNALCGPDRWVVVDPKPYVGDPHADVFAFFDGPPLGAMPDGRHAAREHVRTLTALFAGAAGLDRDRIEAWIRIRALAIVGRSGHADRSGGAVGVPSDPASDRASAKREQLLRLADAVD
jgi:streptomycin 6-kinase